MCLDGATRVELKLHPAEFQAHSLDVISILTNNILSFDLSRARTHDQPPLTKNYRSLYGDGQRER